MKWVSEMPYKKHKVTVMKLQINCDGKKSEVFNGLPT